MVTRTGIKARSISILGRIRPFILELLALEWRKIHSLELKYLWSQLANLDQILCVASLGLGKGYVRFWGRLTLAHWTQVSDRCPLGYLFCSSIGTKATSKPPTTPREQMYRPVWRTLTAYNPPAALCPRLFSSPKPNAHWWAYSIGRHPSSVVRRPSVNIFKYILLRSHWSSWSQILCGGSTSRRNQSSFKRSWSYDQDGRHAHIW